MEHDQIFNAAGQCCCPGCMAAAQAAAAADASSASGSDGASASGSNPYYVDALVNEYQFQWGSMTPGTGATVTYSFLSSAPDYYYYTAPEAATFSAMNAEQQDAVRAVLQMYSEVADLHFVEVSGIGSIAFGNADLGTGIAGWAYYPYPGYNGPSDDKAFGDVWITSRYTSYDHPVVGAATFTAYIHEIGHALGLKHPGNYNAGGGGTGGPYLPTAEDSQKFTVMSYYASPDLAANNYAAPVTPLLYDIAAIQYLYGANTSYHAGDDVYTFATSAAIEAIWDAGGNDTFDASNQLRGVVIDLHAGAFSSIAGKDNVAIAFGATIEAAIGSNYNDRLVAGDAGATLSGGLGADTLIGGAGNDVLIGGAGSDTVSGGAGADRFVFDSVPLVSGQDADIITDYNSAHGAFDATEGDLLDLSQLLSALYGAGAAAATLVRAIADAGGLESLLQIDLDGTADTAAWRTVAHLTGIHEGDGLAVVLDANGTPVDIVVEHAPTPPGPVVAPNAGADVFFGTSGDDTLDGGTGDDVLIGGDGNDTLLGGDGNDTIAGNAGNDTIDGGSGDDSLGGDDGDDYIDGGDGNDVLFGGAGDDVLHGGAGDDIIVGMDGNDIIWGGDGNDQANGGAGDDMMMGGLGNDIFGGGSGDDILVGDAGDDMLWGEDGNDRINGGDGADVVVGGAGDDMVGGGDGDDIIVGGDGNDTLFGEAGNDRLNGGDGDDIVLGGDGNDEVGGGAGNDDLNGGAGDDALFGEDGNDTLNGSTGNDILLGGAGNDVFVFTSGDGNDIIVDFAAGSDHIWFNGASLHSFSDVAAHASYNAAANVTTISYDGGTITLNGVTLSHLTAGDFIFT